MKENMKTKKRPIRKAKSKRKGTKKKARIGLNSPSTIKKIFCPY